MSPEVFLRIYGPLVAVCVIVSWIAVHAPARRGGRTRPDIPAQPDPYLIAWLRGGPCEVLRIAVLHVVDRGLVSVGSFSPRPTRRAAAMLQRNPGGVDASWLPPVEQAVMGAVEVPRRAPDLFRDRHLMIAVHTASAALEGAATAQGLFIPDRRRRPGQWIRGIATLAVLGVGAGRLVSTPVLVATEVAPLVAIGVGGLLLLARMRTPRLTRHGRAYLGQLRQACRGARISTGEGGYVLAAAVLGPGALVGTAYDFYPQVFDRASSASGGCGG